MAEGDNIKIYPEDYKKEEIQFDNPLLGQFNLENMQMASLALKKLGLEQSVINEALAQAKAPPGRFESIDEGQSFLVIVDYAHTPDGLEKVLLTAKKLRRQKKAS